MIDVKLNKELQNYHESVFFGLSLRQTVCSVLAIGAAVGLHFLLSSYLHKEIVSWISLLGAVPFALMGFFRYNGMTAEKFFVVWIRCKLLEPKILCCRTTNTYYELTKEIMNKRKKGGKKRATH